MTSGGSAPSVRPCLKNGNTHVERKPFGQEDKSMSKTRVRSIDATNPKSIGARPQKIGPGIRGPSHERLHDFLLQRASAKGLLSKSSTIEAMPLEHMEKSGTPTTPSRARNKLVQKASPTHPGEHVCIYIYIYIYIIYILYI